MVYPPQGAGTQGPPGPAGEGIPSTPPAGQKKIINVYWDNDTEEFVFEHES